MVHNLWGNCHGSQPIQLGCVTWTEHSQLMAAIGTCLAERSSIRCSSRFTECQAGRAVLTNHKMNNHFATACSPSSAKQNRVSHSISYIHTRHPTFGEARQTRRITDCHPASRRTFPCPQIPLLPTTCPATLPVLHRVRIADISPQVSNSWLEIKAKNSTTTLHIHAFKYSISLSAIRTNAHIGTGGPPPP